MLAAPKTSARIQHSGPLRAAGGWCHPDIVAMVVKVGADGSPR
jgi:hypothetical protein